MGNLLKDTPFSEIMATLERLDQYDVTRGDLARLRKRPTLARKIAVLLTERAQKEKALEWINDFKAIMGGQLFGPDHWRAFGAKMIQPPVEFPDDFFDDTPPFPWAKEILEGPCPFYSRQLVKETHFAFLGVRILDGLRLTVQRWPNLRSPMNFEWIVRDMEPLAEETCSFTWYLMPLVIPTPGRGRAEDWAKKLPKEYEPARTIEEVTKCLLYRALTGEMPAMGVWAWCESTPEGVDLVEPGYRSYHYGVGGIHSSNGGIPMVYAGLSPSHGTGIKSETLAVKRKPGV